MAEDDGNGRDGDDPKESPEKELLRKAADALVQHACRILPGDEEPDMGQINNTILLLSSHQMGVVFLKRSLGRVNNADNVLLVKSYISTFAADLELKSKGGKHSSLIPVIHAASVVSLCTAAIGLAAGTSAWPFGVVIVGILSVTSVTTSVSRIRQFSQDAHYKRDADLVKSLLTMLP